MGIDSRTVTSIDELKKAMSRPIDGVSVVVAQVPSREANADNLKDIYEKMNSI